MNRKHKELMEALDKCTEPLGVEVRFECRHTYGWNHYKVMITDENAYISNQTRMYMFILDHYGDALSPDDAEVYNDCIEHLKASAEGKTNQLLNEREERRRNAYA